MAGSSTFRSVTRFPTSRLAFCLLLCACHSVERDNAVDPAVQADGQGLFLVVALPKPLTTVVDSLTARLEGPDMPTVVRPLVFLTPAGPATLTIGTVSPGSDRVLTIEGYDLTGRLILSGERRNITIVTGDTTHVSIDLRLVIDPGELEGPDPAAVAVDTTADG